MPADSDPRLSLPPQYGPFVLLLVEDEPLLLRSSRRMLEARGFQVLTAEDARSAWTTARAATQLDLLVTDISLPGTDGIELAARLVAERPGLKVLLMSGLDAEHRGGRVPEARTWAFLPKPFASRDLDACLSALLGPPAPP